MGEEMTGVVDRRFQDIKKLRSILVEEGITEVPPLPSQHLNRLINPNKDFFSHEFQMKRMQEINHFLTCCDK
ncbi:MAG: hypothetical protein MHPSP_001337, partial [Paramarteilia canceri]